MTQFLDWRGTADQRDLVRHAVETLARGGTVAFPVEAVYTIAAGVLHPEALERITKVVERPLTVAVRGHADALDWSPRLSEVGRRLARRCWPGPVTLICDGSEEGVAGRLPEAARSHILADRGIRLRAPAH